MARSQHLATLTETRTHGRDGNLLLRETNNPHCNDMQLVVSLLRLQSRRAASAETRAALADAMERVDILARARSAFARDRPPSLAAAPRQVCDALRPYAEPRSIAITLQAAHEAQLTPV